MLQGRQEFLAELSQLVLQAAEVVLVGEEAGESLLVLQILAAEQVLHPERLELAADVPSLILANPLLHKLHHLPCGALACLAAVADGQQEAVDGARHGILRVKVDTEAARQTQLVGQIGKKRLEKGVDGFHPETVVVVKDGLQCCPGALGDDFGRKVQSAGKVVHETGIQPSVGGVVELRQDAVFHFCRGFVGESDGQRVGEGGGLARFQG